MLTTDDVCPRPLLEVAPDEAGGVLGSILVLFHEISSLWLPLISSYATCQAASWRTGTPISSGLT